MKVVIVGDGQVGDTLAKAISEEGHSVTVVDKNAMLVNRVVNQYDVQGIAGNGARQDVLAEAGVGSADLFIAATPSDELNLVCCMLARQMGADHTVARVRDPDFSDERNILRNSMGIDLVVNPEFSTAREIVRLVRFPAALKLDAFANGQVDMAEIQLEAGHPLVGLHLSELYAHFGVRVLICAIQRGEEVYIPSGEFVLREGDRVSITASHSDLSAFFGKLGLMEKPIRSAMLLGGGHISFYLAEQLVKLGIRTTIVEENEAHAAELSAALPKVSIIVGDCTDSDLLEEEGISETDACIALTDNDEENAIVSMFARTRGVERIITKIDRLSFLRMLPQIGLDCTVSPRQVSCAKVLRFLRGLENRQTAPTVADGGTDRTGGIKTLYKLCDDGAEALEFDVDERFRHLGVPFLSPEFALKPNTLIASIVRHGTVIYPHGSSTLEVGDSVVVVSTDRQLCELNDILA